MAVAFDAFADYTDQLRLTFAPGTPAFVPAGTKSGFLVSLCQNGRPFPAGQLSTVVTQEADDFGNGKGRMTVVEEVGDEAPKRRYGKSELSRVIASRTYSYGVWWNARQGKWNPEKGQKPTELKKLAPWKTPEGKAIDIWCFMVPVASMALYGFKGPTADIGTRRKQGTRIEGRENGTKAPDPVAAKGLEVNSEEKTWVNPDKAEVMRRVEVDVPMADKPPLNYFPEVTDRFSKLDLD